MRLHIGKNHKGKTSNPVQSIFRLAGSDEDALTYALGFLLARDHEFCFKLVKLLGVASRQRLSREYSIHLQEVTGSRFGRRDIVIEDSGLRIVLEAKIGRAEPSAEQLLKYATEKDLWNQYSKCGLVALTQVKLAPASTQTIRTRLEDLGIRFGNIQWHDVLELAINHRRYVESNELRYLFDEFISFVRKDYGMDYFDAEILIQDVDDVNAKIFEEGWMYVTDPKKDKKAPLYFAPYFTEKVPKSARTKISRSGLFMISRVLKVEVAVLADKKDVILDGQIDECQRRWSHGLKLLQELRGHEHWTKFESRFFYLDQPITFRPSPITKKLYNKHDPPKKIGPYQIPKGFTLGFDEILNPALASD